MSKTSHRKNERGVALLMTIFGLLLLTAVVTAMLYSSNSETMISVNYRDKDSATYAAMSGLQEARNRIQPVFGDLALAGKVPVGLPGSASGQVLYIVNPGVGQTVNDIAPWSATVNGKPNPYFDTELCQENVLGMTGKPGVPCTSVPSGSTWYSVYDNSANATNWKLTDASGNAAPLDYKWVRVTLKADNNTPTYVQNATAANGTQVCWDGVSHQLQLPAGAGANCNASSTGSPVQTVTLLNGGSGYDASNPPTVTFVGGGGAGATATVHLKTAPGSITSASTNPGKAGSGYTSPPTVTITTPDGSGATFSALVNGAPITKLALSSSNYCYPTGTTGETVNFQPTDPGTGHPATATVTMTGQECISAATATASCGNSLKNKALTINLSSGGFSGNVTLDGSGAVSGASVAITNVGTYTTVPASQTITGVTSNGKSCSVSVSFTGGIQIASLNLTDGGEYLAQPTAQISGSNPTAPNATQPTVTATWKSNGVANFGSLKVINVTNPGTGYMNSSYGLTFTGGGGTGAVGTALAGTSTSVDSITLTNGGGGYTTAPQVQIAAGLNTSASASATIAGTTPSNYGSVYLLTALAVTRNGSGARALAQMEVGVRPPWKFKLGGALTLAGPSPTFGSPNSNIFQINGTDANSCGETKASPLPAIGVYDDPNNPTSPTAQESVIDGLGKPKNYIGANSAPDIENVFNSLGADPSQLNALVDDLQGLPGTNNVTGPATSLPNMGSATNPVTTVVNGDLTLSGNPSGYGVLVVTGNLTLNGDFTWHGVILVIGNAVVNNQGGGNGQITGALYVANTNGSTLGTPTFNWNGGGGNGIQYDHCWADNLLNKYPPAPSARALQVLSSRMLQF